MDPSWAVLLYIVIVIVGYIICRKYAHLHKFSSFALSLLIAIVLLSILCPMSSIDKSLKYDPVMAIYAFIISISALIILFYVVWKSVTDHDKKYKDEFSWNSIQNALKKKKATYRM